MPYHLRYLDLSSVDLARRTAPALSLACTLAASLVACEVAKILTGKGRVRPAPAYVQVDLLCRRLRRGRVLLGGRNPLQRAKRMYLRWKAGAAAGGAP